MLLDCDKFIGFFDIKSNRQGGDLMTVYIDVLFTVNMLVNYFLLLIAAGIAKTPYNRLRLLLASVIGGIYCVLIYTADISILQNIIFKIASTFAISIIAFKYINLAHFLRCTFLLFAVGFSFVGIVYGVYFLLQPQIMDVKNSIIYIHISPITLILCSLICYVVILLFNYLLKPHTISESERYEVTISYHSKSVVATGFVDTGNLLTDVFTDYPVILCSFLTVESLFSLEEKSAFYAPFSGETDIIPKSFRCIPVSTVSGSCLLPMFKPDSVILKSKSSRHHIERVLVAVFNPENYQSPHKIILNPELVLEKSQGGKIDVH